jgi:hypothetical protein
VSNKVNYLIYSHYHADHAGASSLFDKNVTRIGHEEMRRVLLRDDDPARPPNEETFTMPAKPASAALSGDYVVFDGRGALAVPGLRAVIRQPQPDPHVCSTADARRALGRSEPRRVATYRAFEAAARENGPDGRHPREDPHRLPAANELRGRDAEETLGRRTRRSRPQARERTFSAH